MYRSIYIKTSLFACTLAGFVVILFLLGVGRPYGIVLASSTVGARNASQTPDMANGKLASSAPDCGSVWEVEPSPSIDRTFLKGVAALSSSDIWAVGAYYSDGALIEHYDGTAWSVVPSPNVDGVAGGLPGGLTAVAASASNDVWAVGSTCCGPTVIEHWDGTLWSIVASPSYGSLNGIAIVSSNDVWAVGDHNTGRDATLAVHWNGTAWTEISPLEYGALSAVSAVSSNDVWAVGETNGETLTEHWDGSAWNVVPSVDPFSNNYFTGVSAISSNDVWAVGYSAGAPGPRTVTLIEHWDGSAWSIVTSPNVGTQNNYLNAISAISSNNVWTVGTTDGGFSQLRLIEHWDGSSWTISQSPGSDDLMGMASLPNSDIWAVGITYANDSFQGSVLSYTLAPCPPTATPPPANCGPEWHPVSSPYVDTGDIHLLSLAAVSSNDVWAVGWYRSISDVRTLTEHWDGIAWTVISSLNVGDYSILNSIAAIAANEVWAVGYSGNGGSQPLVEHWNGTIWSLVPTPDIGPGTILYGVASLSSSNLWAVGSRLLTGGGSATLVEHWDGAAWSVVTSPNPNAGSYLAGVSAISSNDAWAVGHSDYGSKTLVEHWNGRSWSIVPSPNVSASYNHLNGVSAISSTEVWAVGHFDYGSKTLVEHWNGSAWSVISSPNVGVYSNLNSVAAVSSNDVWAVGFSGTNDAETFIEHWDGTAWSVVPSPNIGTTYNYLYGVAAVSGTDVWAVGNYVRDSFGYLNTLIEQYSMVPCPPTPTPVPPRCPGERFTDVCPGDYFYQHVLDLNDLGIVAGYNSAPPCEGVAYIPCFKPYNWTTRGQISKVVSLAAGFNDPVSGQTFADVLPDHTFYAYIERMAARGIIVGYPCGGSGEPCDANNSPYFRPGNSVGRGQLTKMVALAFDLGTSTSDQTFEDVVPGYTFYPYIERLAVLGIIQGYPCGNAGEPCVPPDDRPYFRPANIISRGQISKIVNLARTQSTTPTTTPTLTAIIPTPSFTVTPLPSATETSTPIGTSQATETPSATATSTVASTP